MRQHACTDIINTNTNTINAGKQIIMITIITIITIIITIIILLLLIIVIIGIRGKLCALKQHVAKCVYIYIYMYTYNINILAMINT